MCISALTSWSEIVNMEKMSCVMRKPVFHFGGSDPVGHKPGCTATEDGQRPEISDLGSRESVLSM